MFQVRAEQLQKLSRQRLESFIADLVQRLKTDFSDDVARLGLSAEDLDPLVRRGIKTARGYGVVNQQNVRLYVDCMVMLHPNFDRNSRFPWAKKVLSDEALSGAKKMRRIHDELVFGKHRIV